MIEKDVEEYIEAMATIHLRLLGNFECVADGEGLGEISLAKDKGILGILALSEQYSSPRSRLIDLLWSSRNDQQSRTSLRQSLWSLKKILGRGPNSALQTDRTRIFLNSDRVRIDTTEFYKLCASTSIDALEKALTLYRGELLEGLIIRDKQWDEWLTYEREHLRAKLIETLSILIDHYNASKSKNKNLIGTGRRLIELDSLNEKGHRALMRGYAESNQRGLALTQYERCCEILQHELHTRPEKETETLFTEIIQKNKANATENSEEPTSDVISEVNTNKLSRFSLAGKPSIAVLPFTNLSGDPDQEFIADGISEDIITSLSKIRSFFVIARNSTFTYKNKTVSIIEIASDLGVRYVLEGSIRKAGNRVRVSAQLIDAASERQVWGERYDHDLDDIFELQDSMTLKISAALEPELNAIERARAVRKSPKNLDAWELYQRALWHMWTYEDEETKTAMGMFEQAIEADRGFAPAHAYYAYSCYITVIMGYAKDPESRLQEGMNAARMALKCDDKDAISYFAIGRIYMMQAKHDASIAALNKSIELNPCFAQAYHGLGFALSLAGELEESKLTTEKALSLSPRDPMAWAFTIVHALTSILDEEFEESLVWVNKTIQISNATGYWTPAVMASALANLDRMAEAKDALRKAVKVKPDLSIQFIVNNMPTKHEGGLNPYLDGLMKAGLT